MKILAIIPARGGSKGIPRKNLADINGKPLISYSIEAAREALVRQKIQAMVVSTDDVEIAEVSKKFGAEVPFMRPSKLSEDESPSTLYVKHALDWYEKKGVSFGAILILQPTCPLRNTEDIVESIEIFEKSKCESLISVYREDYVNELVTYTELSGVGVPFSSQHSAGVRRQTHGSKFVRNGAIYLFKTEFFLNSNRLISENPKLYLMPKKRSINIDNFEDLEIAEALESYRNG